MKRNLSQAFAAVAAGRLCQRTVTVTLSVICCLCLMVATERRAYGYINPGDGLLALQSLASVVAAGAYFMRRRIAELFSRGKKPGIQPATVAPNAAASTVRKDDARNAA